MRKQIYARQPINEMPVTMKVEKNTAEGQTWLYTNPTGKEVEAVLDETSDRIPYLRFLIAENGDIVLANGWFWTHDEMYKNLRKPPEYFAHYVLNMLTNAVSLGGYTEHMKGGYEYGIKRLRDTFTRLQRLDLVDLSTKLHDWDTYTGTQLRAIVSTEKVA